MERLYREYKHSANFYFVYVREAHPTDGRQLAANEREKILVKSPTTIDERSIIASNCVSSLKLSLPCLIDSIDNATQKSYQGWPSRACVIDTNGIIHYISRPGPRGVNPEQMRKALKEIIPTKKTTL